jgi:hypothetical protein
MSNSTISTVNKYLLNAKSIAAVATNPLLASNVSFPDDFNGLRTEFNTTESQLWNDCRKVFSVTGDTDTWKNSTDGYQILSSSYLRGASAPSNCMAIPNIYCNLPDDSGGPSGWSVNRMFNGQWAITNYLDGVDIGNYNVDYVYTNSGTLYIGGGTGYFYTTSYNNNTGAVSGEWFEQKFPFKAQMKSISFMARRSPYINRCVKTVYILGSDTGVDNWFLIKIVTGFTAYTDGVFQTLPITTDQKFQYIRFVITETTGGNSIQIQEVKMTFDAYVL